MKYRRFGQTEMLTSQITLGGLGLAGETPVETVVEIVQRSVQRGINHIETARGYGASEERLGIALKEVFKDVPRESIYITTKIGASSDVDEFKRHFELSQQALDLEYIDNLDFHGPGSLDSVRPALSSAGCLGYVRKLQDEGRVRHLGFSTHGYPKGVMEVVNTREFSSVNVHYYFFYQGLRDIVKRAAELDMGVFIISPSAGGGRLHSPTDRLVAACQPLTPVAFNQMWLLNQPAVHTLSCGPKTSEEVDGNLLAADYDGTGEARRVFDRVLANVERAYRSALEDTFCAVCNECLPCPEDINIPALLNWRNMAVAFEMVEYAEDRYSRVGQGGAWVLGVKGDQCTKCGDCLPRCPEDLQIPELLWDAHQRLETGEVRRPRWDHEGDLLKTHLKQS